jgi:hypothetical protein
MGDVGLVCLESASVLAISIGHRVERAFRLAAVFTRAHRSCDSGAEHAVCDSVDRPCHVQSHLRQHERAGAWSICPTTNES